MEGLAEPAVLLGGVGVVTAVLNAVALRLVRVDEVPGWLQVRISWWRAHNRTLLLLSAVTAGVGVVARLL
ncbi:hypothetical protein ACQP00_18975 [Dactylosporangium sp. CS-047395]|uniref:hypothetical protein n=1 Tax=Dactylosporangium sp. CS-047395 TaxID=3239936 RepID=UPI003D8BE7C0